MDSLNKINSEQGYTLIEIMMVLVIVAVIGWLAAPDFRATEVPFHKATGRSLLIQDLKRGQAEAITLGCKGIFTIDADSEGYNFGCDFLDYDTNVPPSPDQISFTRSLPRNVTIDADAEIIFNSRGQAVDTDGVLTSVTISLYDSSEGSPQQFSWGTLYGTGVFSFYEGN